MKGFEPETFQPRELAEPGPAWKAAEAEGYDMSLIEENLRKTPEERIRAHSRALAMATALREAMEAQHGRD
ncbi:hypothetical protein [Pedosphaera parvula]|uniref:Uncharacterized protein n=1 Tax=Pedosphaera parvula (strain Ellin514) TaxID=320771 RepID=B9XLY6_PEDPL|nr:hypothetical protein [Pedosphaera parvula]EEF59114.1 hypothetical protein Cflav_PD1606 [Pedosphaera parvula Ellin514]